MSAYYHNRRNEGWSAALQFRERNFPEFSTLFQSTRHGELLEPGDDRGLRLMVAEQRLLKGQLYRENLALRDEVERVYYRGCYVRKSKITPNDPQMTHSAFTRKRPSA